MKFRTEVSPSPFSYPINISDKIVLMGSCFSSHIGSLLAQYKFNVLTNPLGILFHPIPISKHLTQHPIDPRHIVTNDDAYFHMDVHSEIWDTDINGLMDKITGRRNQLNSALSEANWLIVTLGTAYIYKFRGSTQLVANCQKQPAALFDKQLSTADDVVTALQKSVDYLKHVNPELKILLTVSPVRHIKDGIPENQVSKSILRVACDEMVRINANCHYFPSYEIMMDDLRDYRFYKDDLIHPNEQAIQYIWEKFKVAAFDDAGRAYLEKTDSILARLNHKPFNPKSEAHKRFLEKLREDIAVFSDKDWTKEMDLINQYLS